MALNANALVSVEMAKGYLSITGGQQDTAIEDLINRASTLAERVCNRSLKQQDFVNVRMPGPNAIVLYPRAIPIDPTKPVTIVVDDIAQTVWKQESDGARSAKDVIVMGDIDNPVLRPNAFYRAGGWGTRGGWAASWPGDPYNVLLTYSGGFATIPDDLREACFLIAQKLLRDQSKGLAEVVSVTTPGGSLTMLDTTIPRRAWDILCGYRWSL